MQYIEIPKVHIGKRGWGDIFDDMLARTFEEADKNKLQK